MTSGRLRIASSTAATVVIDGRERVLFAGCDYLSLAHHPRVVQALVEGAREFGVSSSGSRETTGNTTAHDRLEDELAAFLGVEAALVVPDGYLSNLIVAQALPDACDTILFDRESHVSVRDAVAASGRAPREYAFVDAAAARAEASRVRSATFAIVTDGVFPVMRAVAPLRALLEILPRDGLLIVDDCHGLGVLGARGRGSVELAGLSDARVVTTGTFSKALGCFGGFVAGSREHVERTRARARAYVGSTPIPPALARAAGAALRVVDEEPDRRARLFRHVERVRGVFRERGLSTSTTPFPVFSFRSTNERRAATEAAFAERGLLVPWIEYPDGLGGYYRLALRAGHTDEHVTALCEVLRAVLSASSREVNA